MPFEAQQPEEVISKVGKSLGLEWELCDGDRDGTRRFSTLSEGGVQIYATLSPSSSRVSLSLRKPSIKPWQPQMVAKVERMMSGWEKALTDAFGEVLGVDRVSRSKNGPFIFLSWESVGA